MWAKKNKDATWQIQKPLVGLWKQKGTSEDFGGNKNKLIKWYKKLGFVENVGRKKDYEIRNYMYRLPEEVVQKKGIFKSMFK